MKHIKHLYQFAVLFCLFQTTKAQQCPLFSSVRSDYCVIATISAINDYVTELRVDSLVYGSTDVPKMLSVVFEDSIFSKKKENSPIGTQFLFFINKQANDTIYSSLCENPVYSLNLNNVIFENEKVPKNIFFTTLLNLKQNYDSIESCLLRRDTLSAVVQNFASQSKLQHLLIQQMISRFTPCRGGSPVDETMAQVNNNQFAIAPSKMNVLYIGIDNPLQIEVSGHKQFYVSIDNGQIFKKGDIFYARVNKPGTNVITIYLKPNKQKPLFTYTFRVKRIPDPIASINGKRSSIRTKEFFSTATRLDLEMNSFDFDLSYSVVSFSMCITKLNNSKIVFKTHGSNFSPEMIAALKTLEESDKVLFYNIIATAENDIRTIGSILFRVRCED